MVDPTSNSISWLIDWFVFNASFNGISAISWHKQIRIKSVHLYLIPYYITIFIPLLLERGLYCNHLVRPSVCLSIRSHFRNIYLSFYWKKWLHIYFLFTVRLTNERVGVFLARRSMQHLVSLCSGLPWRPFISLDVND